MKKHLLILVAAVLAVSVACNKTKKSTKLLGGDEWHVTELSVDGENEEELPHLKFNDCDAYNESCTGEWANHEGGMANFAWQFREKGETFEISNQSELSEGEHAQEEAVLQCQYFSGTYEVTKREKTSMEFKTTAALGHPGQTVVMKIEKQ